MLRAGTRASLELRLTPAVVRVAARASAATCAYCHDPLDPARHDCGCGAAYHRDCWAELGACATLGCAGRADVDDRRRGGRCPGCHGKVTSAFAWERLACAGCGAVYHLGCRGNRARCATRGCGSGDHDGWGVPRPAPRRPRLTADQRELVARSLASLGVSGAVTSTLLALTGNPVVSLSLGVAAALCWVIGFAPLPRPRQARRAGLGRPGRGG
ncbi:MAG: hypothetical protein M9894_27990 [Planctomycetes bacterium]|nr:hypothetical protein [Planctomycetota bacterium]